MPQLRATGEAATARSMSEHVSWLDGERATDTGWHAGADLAAWLREATRWLPSRRPTAPQRRGGRAVELARASFV